MKANKKKALNAWLNVRGRIESKDLVSPKQIIAFIDDCKFRKGIGLTLGESMQRDRNAIRENSFDYKTMSRYYFKHIEPMHDNKVKYESVAMS